MAPGENEFDTPAAGQDPRAGPSKSLWPHHVSGEGILEKNDCVLFLVVSPMPSISSTSARVSN